MQFTSSYAVVHIVQTYMLRKHNTGSLYLTHVFCLYLELLEFEFCIAKSMYINTRTVWVITFSSVTFFQFILTFADTHLFTISACSSFAGKEVAQLAQVVRYLCYIWS